jgi:hypothetical protein
MPQIHGLVGIQTVDTTVEKVQVTVGLLEKSGTQAA